MYAAANTFGVVAAEYLAKQKGDGRAEATLTKNAWLLEDLAGALADRPISLITTQEVLAVLRRIEARGRHESAQRTRAAISRVFRYGIATGRVTSDPSNPLIGAIQVAKVRHRAAIIEPKGVGELMRAIYGIDNSVVIKAALQLMALCFPRPGELRHAEWSEIDLDKAVWTIPEHRTKMRRPHAIPLPPQAVTIFRDLKEITGHRKLVFPGVRSPLRPLSENTLNATLRRLGYTVDEMTAHGFRTIASTLLNESGKWNPDAVERALAHQEGNAVRRAYARGAYWDERVKMAKWWANHLDHLREQSPVETKRASGRKNSSPRKIAA